MLEKPKFHAGETKVSCRRNQSFTLEKPKFHAEETKVIPCWNFCLHVGFRLYAVLSLPDGDRLKEELHLLLERGSRNW